MDSVLAPAGKPVVFIHGWSLGSAIWSLQADWLAAQGLRVIAYDRRGHAGSDKPADGYDFDTLAAASPCSSSSTFAR